MEQKAMLAVTFATLMMLTVGAWTASAMWIFSNRKDDSGKWRLYGGSLP